MFHSQLGRYTTRPSVVASGGRPTSGNRPTSYEDDSPPTTADEKSACQKVLDKVLPDKTHVMWKGHVKLFDCPGLHVYCGNCGKSGSGRNLDGQTREDPATGYIHVCIGNHLQTDLEVEAILIHEVYHAGQIAEAGNRACNIEQPCTDNWTMPDLKRPPDVSDEQLKRLCDDCIRIETPAYEASCKYQYPDKTTEAGRSRRTCVDAGVCHSCAHVCPDLQKKAKNGKCEMPNKK